jgi:hypothetical protein
MARLPTKPPLGVTLSPLLTIRSRDAAHEWIVHTLGVPLRKNIVIEAANNRTIPCVKIGGALYFSTQSLFDWVTSFTEEGNKTA